MTNDLKNFLEEDRDRIQNYREHLELLCDHSKMEYCVGCGMTIQFFDKIVQIAKNDLLDLVEKSFENLHEKYTVDYTNHDVLKIINNLRV